jgi:hypothetical protein
LHPLDGDKSFSDDELRPLVVPRLCSFKGTYALFISMSSIVDVANAAEDATCFVFGVIKPSFFILDVVVSLVIGVATLISPSFASFLVCAVGSSGVTFVVSVV